jgi:membrane protease YdiL (CAAX protease family)
VKRIFVGAEDRVRSGWVVAAFSALALVIIFGLNFALDALGLGAPVMLDDPRIGWLTWPTLLGALAATALGHFAFKEPVGLARERAGKHFMAGLGAGTGLLAVACVVPAVAGVTSLTWSAVSPVHFIAVTALHVVCVAPTAIAEELLLRGVPLRALSRGLNPAVAVVLTGLVFGGLHLMNPSASLVAALNVALVGVWFGAVAVRTGSLWMPFGLHVGWNFAEGVVFGQPVSGLWPGTALFAASWPREAGFFSGGDFGPEAAGWTAVLLALAIAATVAWPTRARTA